MKNLDDIELLALARNGEDRAFDELFERHHKSACDFAVGVAGPDQAQDRVAEAFARIYRLLRQGKGPDRNFRAYLLTTVRHAHVDALRRTGAEVSVENVAELGDVVPVPGFEDRVAERLDAAPIKRVFAGLRPSWQRVLWHTVVLGQSNEVAAQHLGSTANAVGVLAFRAREGLRQAYLADHLEHTDDGACHEITARLPRFVRGQLPVVRQRAVDAHLVDCARCTTAARDLTRINEDLPALLTPAVVLAGAAWTGGGDAAVESVLGVVTGHKLLAVGAALVAVAATVATVVVATGPSPSEPVARPPGPQLTVAAPSITPRPTPAARRPRSLPPTSPTATPTPKVGPSVPGGTRASSPTVHEVPARVGAPRVTTSGSDQVRSAEVASLVRAGRATTLTVEAVGVTALSVSSAGLTCAAPVLRHGAALVRCAVRQVDDGQFLVVLDLRFADPATPVRGSLALGGGADARAGFVATT